MDGRTRKLLTAALLLRLGSVGATGRPRYIVHAHESVELEACHSGIVALGGKVHKKLQLIRALVCEFPDVELHTLSAVPEFALVEPDIRVKIPCWQWRRPSVSQQQIPWGIKRIAAQEAWPRSTGQGVRVGLIDTGVDRTHRDLAQNVVKGTNTIDPSASFNDDNGHGTAVGGVIAALNNNVGVVGVAPNAGLYVAKALDREGQGNLSDVIEAMQWCVDEEVQVINMSLGTTETTMSFRKAVDAVLGAGIQIIAAAGNDGPDDGTVLYPAAFESVIAVGAIDEADQVAEFSARGPQVDLVAPGVKILSTAPRGQYQELDGTSLAAPFITGTATLWLSLQPQGVPAQLTRALLMATSPLDGYPATAQGHGVIDAARAVASV